MAGRTIRIRDEFDLAEPEGLRSPRPATVKVEILVVIDEATPLN